VQDPIVVGLVTAGILAAIMSSLDSQFLCLGTMFTNDIILHDTKKQYSDRQTVLIARGFIVGIVTLVYVLSLLLMKKNVFDLAIWSFSGFAGLTPLVLAALYWKRATKVGAYACVIAAFSTWLIFFVKSGYGGEYNPGGVTSASVIWVVAALAMIIGSLLSPPPSDDEIAKYF